MSSQIRADRKKYYNTLEKTQKGSLDITEWLLWYLRCLEGALQSSEVILSKVFEKHRLLANLASETLNDRQRLMINKLLDDFDGNLTTSKWAKIAKCSQDTALRDIRDLVNRNILTKNPSGGRSTSYILINSQPDSIKYS